MEELIRDILLWTTAHGHTNVGRPAKTFNHQLCADTRRCLEDFPRVMANRERWQERVKGIHAVKMP